MAAQRRACDACYKRKVNMWKAPIVCFLLQGSFTWVSRFGPDSHVSPISLILPYPLALPYPVAVNLHLFDLYAFDVHALIRGGGCWC